MLKRNRGGRAIHTLVHTLRNPRGWEFDVLVEHSEALARELRPDSRELTPFERLVADAIDGLPPGFA